MDSAISGTESARGANLTRCREASNLAAMVTRARRHPPAEKWPRRVDRASPVRRHAEPGVSASREPGRSFRRPRRNSERSPEGPPIQRPHLLPLPVARPLPRQNASPLLRPSASPLPQPPGNRLPRRRLKALQHRSRPLHQCSGRLQSSTRPLPRRHRRSSRRRKRSLPRRLLSSNHLHLPSRQPPCRQHPPRSQRRKAIRSSTIPKVVRLLKSQSIRLPR